MAAVAASVIVMGAGAALATAEGDDPGDALRHGVPLEDISYVDDLPEMSEEERRRTMIENLMIMSGEPYTEKDIDRELAEQLAAEELYPQTMTDGSPLEVIDGGIVNIIVGDR